MNVNARFCLRLLRDLIAHRTDFSRGYALGVINTHMTDFEPWVRQYIENIAEQVVWKDKAA